MWFQVNQAGNTPAKKNATTAILSNGKFINMEEKRRILTRRLTERWTPFVWHNALSLGCCQPRWHSTWLTAGVTRAIASKSSNFFEEKLLTPMARAFPKSCNFSIAPHVAGKSSGRISSGLMLLPFLTRTGQWIFKKYIRREVMTISLWQNNH